MLRALTKKAFAKSLWVYHCNSGACNGCDIEILNVLTPYYDVERFGIRLVGSPRHADVMLLSGAVTRPTLPLVKRAFEAIPAPKLVFAIGSCAVGGGCWFDSYNVAGGGMQAVPVDYFIPGCPPRPEAIMDGVVKAAAILQAKIDGQKTETAQKPKETFQPVAAPAPEEKK